MEKEIGKKYPMCHFDINECGMHNGMEFIVLNRYSGDRVSGATKIEYRNGETENFVHDHNDPQAIFVGKGKRIVTIEWAGT